MPSDHLLTSPTSETASGDLPPDGLTAVAEPLPSADALAEVLGEQAADGDGFVFDRRGAGVAAAGVAWRIVVPAGPGQVARAAAAASRALERVARGDGPAPVVVGALPFEGTSPATLAIPRVAVVRREDGQAWQISVSRGEPGNGRSAGGDAPVDLREPIGVDGDGASAASPGASPVPSPDEFMRMVGEARDHIRAGDLEKIVLARTLVVRGDAPFDRGALLGRLLREEPDAYTFAVSRFVGASPELLVSRFGDGVSANPLGGTARRSTEAGEDAAAARALLVSEKDLREHALAADAVVADLTPVCGTLDVRGPVTRGTATLWHLSTEVSGRLADPSTSALDLAALLHPMPAVCGTPTDTALSLIDRLEAFDRKLYGGLVGWMDADGDGEWALALRCAELNGVTATLYAGAGIVADSDPAAELAETDAKFGSMLRALEA